MVKKIQKLTAVFLLGTLLSVVGGFCFELMGNTASAHVEPVIGQTEVFEGDCGSEVAHVEKVQVKSENNTIQEKTSDSEALLPCCIDRHENVPTTESSKLSGITKIVAINALEENLNRISVIEDNINSSSDSSPPKADKLSSVLRLE